MVWRRGYARRRGPPPVWLISDASSAFTAWATAYGVGLGQVAAAVAGPFAPDGHGRSG